MIDSRTVNVEGARVAYRMQGNGPPIVLVNGTAALDVHWGPVIPALAKQWTVISLDYSGSGETTDNGSALSLQKLANQVIGTAKAAGLDRIRRRSLQDPQCPSVLADRPPRLVHRQLIGIDALR